jgi:hypothetical protein
MKEVLRIDWLVGYLRGVEAIAGAAGEEIADTAKVGCL